MRLSSPAFLHDDPIMPRYTCDGQNISPPLKIEDVPEDAKSLALLMEDPDAPGGTFTHWVLWNIPPDTKEIAEGRAPSGAVQGVSDAGSTGYHGPCPPSGTHRYIFTLYALSSPIDAPSGGTADAVRTAMRGIVLEDTDLIGVYERVL